MEALVLVVHVLAAIAIIALVLLQQGKGADMGASFGAGSSATIFGSSGSGNFLTKTTAILATSFFLISLLLGNLTASKVKQTDEWNDLSVPASEQAISESAEPATPAANNSDVPASDEPKQNDVPD
mgnify:CR=1 FL=1